MSQNATELCLLLVDDSYGELASRVFGALATFGRLALPGIIHHTRFNPRQVKHSLALLVQQHLAFWYTSPNDNTTCYEANLTNAYALVQFGKHAEFIEKRLGVSAASILSELHLLGHARVEDLEKSYQSSRQRLPVSEVKGKAGHTNGGHGNGAMQAADEQMEPHAFSTTVKKLLEAQFLAIVHESHFRSEVDNREEAERMVVGHRSTTDGILKGSEKAEIEDNVNRILKEWKFGTEQSRRALERKILTNSPSNGKKRSSPVDDSDDEGRKYKKRLTNGGSHINGSTGVSANHSAGPGGNVLRVNYEKVSILVRNEMLVTKVAGSIGETTSQIYSELLHLMEKDIPSSGDEQTFDGVYDLDAGPRVTTFDIVAGVEHLEDLADSIGPAEADEVNIGLILHSRRRQNKSAKATEAEVDGDATSGEEPSEDEEDVDMEGVEKDDEGLDGEEEFEDSTQKYKSKRSLDPRESKFTKFSRSRLEQVRQHLLLLAEHPTLFVTHHRRGPSSPESWSVPFAALTAQLRRAKLFEIISTRHGSPAQRLARILHEKGKLDEKALIQLSLLNQKIMRAALAAMHGSGHLELQEIPRDNNRQPARTLFLWFFDDKRCGNKMLDETYKAMARLLQRLQVERKKVASVLDKASRTDVMAHEEEMLTKGELATLTRWRATEERMWGELGRLDDVVCLLKEM